MHKCFRENLQEFLLPCDIYAKTLNITFLNFKRWHGCAATIEMDPGSEVYGILWELDNAHLSTLDDQEGVSKKVYRRFEVEVMEIKYR